MNGELQFRSHFGSSSGVTVSVGSVFCFVGLMSVSVAEVAKHSTDSDCWVIVGDQVLDVTKFLPEHPGGKKAIMLFAGKDATEEFDMLHDRKVIKKYGISQGTVTLKGTLAK